MLPPKPDELILPIYSFEALNASEEMGKCKGRPNRAEGCPHPVTLPPTHGADCKTHCFVCMPELRQRPFPRCVSYLPRANSQRRGSDNTICRIFRKLPEAPWRARTHGH
jgi:hypothetical protein